MDRKPAWLAFVALLLCAAPASAADTEHGRMLYDVNCQFCHSRQMHGRKDRWPQSAAELRAVVDQWQRSDSLRWTAADIDDVTAYLNATQYRFAK